MNPEDLEVLKYALVKWGRYAQIEMMIEESIELALAGQKMKRSENDPGPESRARFEQFCEDHD